MTDLEQIKDRVDIVEFIQSYVRLQKAGMNYRAVCPFHSEKTPSFFVSPSRQIWHCFGGCNEGGDIFKFVMKIEGVEFPEALQILAKRAGVQLKYFDKKLVNEKSKLYEISELAAKFFEKQLWESQSGKKAFEYLRSRGLKEETVKEWCLGYAPNTWDSLKVFLKNAGYRDEEIFGAGLTVKRQGQEGYHDRFRGRIMFPIGDLNSQVVGFTGRVFDVQDIQVEQAKYVNTPQTFIYDKGRILYGLDKAKMDIRKNDRAIVVEGNMDVIMSHQAEVKNVIASSGTALTNQHLKILRRYTQNLDLCFDQDLAGETAAKRGIDLAFFHGFNVGVVKVQAKDPADLVKEKPEEWVKASSQNQPIPAFYIEKAFQKHDPKTALGKKNITYEVLPIIKLMENKVEQAHWLDQLANKLRIDQKVIIQAMEEMKTENRYLNTKIDNIVRFETPPRLVLEETLLALLFKMPAKADEAAFASVEPEELEIFQDKFYNGVYKSLKAGNTAGNTVEESLSYEDKLRLELVKFKSEQFFGDREEKDLESEISRLIKSLKKELILEKIKDLELKIRETKNQEEISFLLQKVQKFSNKLGSL